VLPALTVSAPRPSATRGKAHLYKTAGGSAPHQTLTLPKRGVSAFTLTPKSRRGRGTQHPPGERGSRPNITLAQKARGKPIAQACFLFHEGEKFITPAPAFSHNG
jgi:hypothetical protein